MSQMTLFELPAKAQHQHGPCHYCGKTLTEMEALLPGTCERGLTCQDCCTPCQMDALGRRLDRSRAAGRWVA